MCGFQKVRPLLSLYSLKPAVFSLGIFGCSTSRVSHRWSLSHNPNAALFSLNYAGRGRVQWNTGWCEVTLLKWVFWWIKLLFFMSPLVCRRVWTVSRFSRFHIVKYFSTWLIVIQRLFWHVPKFFLFALTSVVCSFYCIMSRFLLLRVPYFLCMNARVWSRRQRFQKNNIEKIYWVIL